MSIWSTSSGQKITEYVLDTGVKRTSGALVIRVVLEEEVDFAVLGSGHHEQFQIVMHLGGRSVSLKIRPIVNRRKVIPAHVMLIVETENREPSSSQLPEVRVSQLGNMTWRTEHT